MVRINARAVLLFLLMLGGCASKQRLFFRDGDRVAWIGSSSTKIGVWPDTMEFLIRTRHPGLEVHFGRATTGGGTFATGAEKLDGWLEELKPTVVVFNYGGNDANAGEAGLEKFRENIDTCIEKVETAGARPILMTHQSSDARRQDVGAAVFNRRKLYAEEMIEYGRKRKIPVLDTHHPLEALQLRGQEDDPGYSILKDNIHLTDAAYFAWACFMYQRLGPPKAVSAATISADGKIIITSYCRVSDVKVEEGGVSFTRADDLLPILPPKALPPRKHVPLEELSRYMLAVTGLPTGSYVVRCEGKEIGTADAAALDGGVNLNSLLLDSGNQAPWQGLAEQIWVGKELDQIGKTSWRFEVRRK